MAALVHWLSRKICTEGRDCGMLMHGSGTLCDRLQRRAGGACRVGRRPQSPAQARRAGAHRAVFGGPADRGRGRPAGWGQPTGGMAMATPFRRSRRRRTSARQDPAPGDRAAASGHRGAGARGDLRQAAGRRHPLDRTGDGQGHGHRFGLGTAHLGGASPATAPPANLQALHRSGFRREGRGYRRPLHSASTWSPRPMPWCGRSTRSRRSRLATAPSPACRSSPANAGP